MTALRFFPERGAPVVGGERLYSLSYARGNAYASLGLKVRARTAAHAEEKLVYCLQRGLSGKTLDFDLDAARRKEAE